MSSGVDAALDLALLALPGLPTTHLAHQIWNHPDRDKVWLVFLKHSGYPDLQDSPDRVPLYFYESFAQMCEGIAKGGAEAQAEEAKLEAVLREIGVLPPGFGSYRSHDRYPNADATGEPSLVGDPYAHFYRHSQEF